MDRQCSSCGGFCKKSGCERENVKPKEWVGLMAKDLAEIPPSCYEGAIWADAKLKEKNNDK